MGNRGMLSPHRPPADLVHQRRYEFLVPSTTAVQKVAGPFRMVGLMPSITQVPLDGLRDPLTHADHCTKRQAPTATAMVRLD